MLVAELYRDEKWMPLPVTWWDLVTRVNEEPHLYVARAGWEKEYDPPWRIVESGIVVVQRGVL